MQAHNGWIVVMVCIAIAINIIASVYIVNNIPEIPEVVIPEYDIPTASEIADAIVVEIPNMPDTFYSVHDEKESIAVDLAIAELDERDVRSDIVDAINRECDLSIERKDISDIRTDIEDIRGFGERATIDLELKVYFDDGFDDAETARIDVTMWISDLDRDDDYEDAEVTSIGNFNVNRCSTD